MPGEALRSLQGQRFFKTRGHLMRGALHVRVANASVSESRNSLAAFGKRHLLLYSELARTSEDWVLYPKHHLFAHLVDRPTANPRETWNYPRESDIGDACVVAARCNSRHLHTALRWIRGAKESFDSPSIREQRFQGIRHRPAQRKRARQEREGRPWNGM